MAKKKKKTKKTAKKKSVGKKKTAKKRKTSAKKVKRSNLPPFVSVNIAKKEVVYEISSSAGVPMVFKRIRFKGFTELPKGFVHKNASGIQSPFRYPFLKHVEKIFGEGNELVLTKNDESSSISSYYNAYRITCQYKKFYKIFEGVKDLRSDNSKDISALIGHFLNLEYPDDFDKPERKVGIDLSYNDDSISRILNSEDKILDKLSKNDISTLAELYPQFIDRFRGEINSAQSIEIAEKEKEHHEKVYLDQLVEDFEHRLNLERQREQEWQEFLQKYILLFNTNYTKVFEKMSVSLGGKYPDFMLLDIYSYIDIFEIKKPNTPLLRYDQSRNNYYWSNELAMAISQVEFYIDSLIKNANHFRTIIKDQQKTDLRVVRPKGIIIAGKSDELDDSNKADFFRLLNQGLSNVDVIPYDDLLGSLKNLRERLSADN